MARKSSWMPHGTHSSAQVRLLCLPHAGAGASVFSSWAEGLDSRIAVCPVQPPGREKRRREQPFTAVEPLAKALAQEIADCVRSPFAFFGHSTGALCVFETARELRRINGPEPLHIFVSGRRAPQLPMEQHDLAALSPTELAQLLRRLGGTPEEVLADPGLLALLQPLLAADFSVNERYTYLPEAPLNVPVAAFVGVEDTGAGVAEMAPWEEQTTQEFRLHPLPGGHFAVFDQAADVHSVVANSVQG